jgi:cysteine-rich repeat protein
LTCRPAASACDAEETCDGSGNCPADEDLPNGTSCDDGDVCTTSDICTNGVCAGSSDLCGDTVLQGACGEECDDGNLTPGDGCSELCLIENCPATVIVGCTDAVQAVLKVVEKSAGKESVKVILKKFAIQTTGSDLGDPVAGTTEESACLYDDSGNLVVSLNVNRPGDTCDGKPCWKAKGDAGWIYKDKALASDGVAVMSYGSGDAEKGKAITVAKNNAANGQTSLPTGIAAQLAGQAAPTIQMTASDGGCFTATMNGVKKDDGSVYIATKK